MNTTARILFAATLLASLSACGNKGPLVQAPAPEAQEETVVPDEAATVAQPGQEQAPATTELAPPAEPGTLPATPATEEPATDETEPVPADPAAPPPPATDDGEP